MIEDNEVVEREVWGNRGWRVRNLLVNRRVRDIRVDSLFIESRVRCRRWKEFGRDGRR